MSEDGAGGSPTVLVVEDEPEVRTTYELWLADEYEVLAAEDGEEALELVDETVDVVLLDRLMPGMSGRDVLSALRERGLDCEVAMVTAVEPEFDVIELGFDDYLVKPPTEEGLRETVENLVARRGYGDRLDRYASLLAKKETLRDRKDERQLDESEEYADLVAELERLEAELDDAETGVDDDAEFVASPRAIEDDTDGRP
jgi:DNA-binding response OmpR family regulator